MDWFPQYGPGVTGKNFVVDWTFAYERVAEDVIVEGIDPDTVDAGVAEVVEFE